MVFVLFRMGFKMISGATFFRRGLQAGLALILGTLIGSVSAQTISAASAPDSMAKRMQACTTCHGAEPSGGRTANEVYFPRIAGKPVGYLYNQLLNFRDGRRHYGLMVGMVEYLSDDYLLEMAQYFAQLDVPYPAPAPLKAGVSPATLAMGKTLVFQGDKARGIPACTACHGTSLMGVAPALQDGKTSRPSMPALLGLPRDYMAGQLGAWQTGLRRAHAPDCMGRIAKLLTAQDVDALASWLATQAVPTAAQGGSKPAAELPAAMPEACGGVK